MIDHFHEQLRHDVHFAGQPGYDGGSATLIRNMLIRQLCAGFQHFRPHVSTGADAGSTERYLPRARLEIRQQVSHIFVLAAFPFDHNGVWGKGGNPDVPILVGFVGIAHYRIGRKGQKPVCRNRIPVMRFIPNRDGSDRPTGARHVHDRYICFQGFGHFVGQGPGGQISSASRRVGNHDGNVLCRPFFGVFFFLIQLRPKERNTNDDNCGKNPNHFFTHL